jgi:transposase InsO family protein
VSQAVLCRVFGHSRQGFYKHLQLRRERDEQEALVIPMVHGIRARQPRVGCRKMLREVNRRLLHLGEDPIGRDRMFALLREKHLLVKPLKRRTYTTDSYHRFRTYRNLLKTVVPSGSNQVWAGDITYLRHRKGFSYLFLLTDVFSRKIVGYHLSESLAAEGALKALRMARRQKSLSDGIIHHSDRGIQYCCDAYVEELKKHKMLVSMTEVNHCYESSLAERVNGTLKNDLLLGEVFLSHKQATLVTKQAIAIYNNERWHESLDYDTPSMRHAA